MTMTKGEEAGLKIIAAITLFPLLLAYTSAASGFVFWMYWGWFADFLVQGTEQLPYASCVVAAFILGVVRSKAEGAANELAKKELKKGDAWLTYNVEQILGLCVFAPAIKLGLGYALYLVVVSK